MPTPANTSTLRTARAMRLRQVLVWAIIGTIVSLALVAASPWISGRGSYGAIDSGRMTRSDAWLRTQFRMRLVADANDPPPTIDPIIAVRQLHESDYPEGVTRISWAGGLQFAYFHQVETGFPLRSFSGWVFIRGNGIGTVTASNGLLEVRGSSPGGIPFTPHWPAILFNAAAWSLALWSISFCPGALRRTLRRRRGLCPHCAYNLTATPSGTPCPECGTLTPPREGT